MLTTVEQEKSKTAIAKEMGTSRQTVLRTLERWENNSSLKSGIRKGRPEVLDLRKIRVFKKAVRQTPKATIRQIQSACETASPLADSHMPVASATVPPEAPPTSYIKASPRAGAHPSSFLFMV